MVQTFNSLRVPQGYLPHNFIAEKSILSCLLLNSNAIEVVIKQVTVKMFYFKNHQEIFNAIVFLYSNKIPIDAITVITFLQDNGKLNKSGGIKILVELTNKIPNFFHLDYYITLLKEKFLRRLILKLSYKTIKSTYLMDFDLKMLLSNFEKEMQLINAIVKPSQSLNMNKLVYKIFTDLKQKSNGIHSQSLQSGFYALDSLTNGFQKSDLIIVAGRPSIGKTAFCLSLAVNIIKCHKLPILFFSLEMSKEQIIYRLLSMETNINQIKLKNGKLSKLHWTKLSKVFKILIKLPLFLNDQSILTTQVIRSILKSLSLKKRKMGIIIIDYLQLMDSSTSRMMNRAYELGQITRDLKNLAREFHLPILALSQLSRSVEIRTDKTPILADLRESGSIEQDADLVLLLSKKVKPVQEPIANSDLLIDISIAKHRNGPTGKITLKFDKKRTKFTNFR